MAQQIISCIILRSGMDLIGLDRWWWQMPFLHQRVTIKDPSEIKTGYLPLPPLNAIHEPEGGRIFRDVRCMRRKDFAVESILRQVSA